MRKTLIFLLLFSLNTSSQDFYKNSYAKEKYGYSISELQKWGFNNRFSYNIEDLKKYKDSTQILNKINYVSVSLKQQVKINEILTDLAKLPNLKNLKFESSSFLRKDIKQKEFPKKFNLLKKIETIIFYGNPNWELNELFLEFSKNKTLKNLSFISFSDSIFMKENFLKIKKLESIKFQARFGPKIPTNISQLKKLKTFILQVDKYPNAKLEFLKLKNLDNLLVSIYEPKNDEITSIINNYTSLKKLTVNGRIKSSKQLFSSISKNKNIETLRIGNNHLKELPKEIGALKNLQSFFSSNNKFSKKLPDEFYQLKKLKNIEIQGSNIEIINEQLNNLTKLENLKLYFNKIKNLPKSISGLLNLKKLCLNYNQIKVLPEDVGKLNLTYLKLNNNSLQELPSSFIKLKKLDTLILSENYIKELPKKIGNLKELKYLNLELNNLDYLPKSVSKLTKLEYLNISRNKITQLPSNFGELYSLKILDSEFCLLKKLPKSFGNLSNLDRLVLTNNNLHELSENFGKLKNLKTLYLHNRESYDYVFQRNFKKDSTISLNVLNNNLTKLPTSFSDLPKLNFIDLSLNKNIDEKQLFTILKLSKFKNYSLNLEGCNIKKLPKLGWDSIKASTLNLRENLITEIPKNIVKSNHLKSLNLNKNKGINTYRGNKTQINLLFAEKGFINENDIPKTDDLVIAYAKTANRLTYNKEYKKSVDYAEKAFKINKELTHKHLYEDNYIEALYHSKNYNKAISFADIQIRKYTSQNLRFLNSIIPNFKYKAKSLLAIGDTIKAIETFAISSKRFRSNNWTEAGMLSKKIKLDSLSKIYFKESIQFYTSYLEKKPKAIGYHLSLVEAYIIANKINLAKNHLKKIKLIDINNKNYKILISYFESIINIIENNDFNINYNKFRERLEKDNIKLTSWSFKLIEDWINLNDLLENKKIKIIQLNHLLK